MPMWQPFSDEAIMARVAAEPIRRAAIVKATIQEVARAGSLEVTVAQIAARAGMSTALAHHYFGSKEAIFVAAMRHVLTVFGAEVRGALAVAGTPRERVEDDGGDGRGGGDVGPAHVREGDRLAIGQRGGRKRGKEGERG